MSAAQLDNTFDTQSYMLQWLPTTGEFGLWGTFGDYDYHEKLATRLGVHYTPSTEDKQSQPGTERDREQPDPPDGRQHHLHARSVRAGHHRRARELPDDERRRRRQVQGPVARGRVLLALAERLHRRQHRRHPRHQRQRLPAAGVGDGSCRSCSRCTSATSAIFGDYGDPWEVRGGVNWYPVKERGFRVNAEWIHVNHSPVGYTAYPYAGRRQRQRVPHQPRAELLIDAQGARCP